MRILYLLLRDSKKFLKWVLGFLLVAYVGVPILVTLTILFFRGFGIILKFLFSLIGVV